MSRVAVWLTLFAGSMALTGAGCLFDAAPFVIAYLPLAGVLLVGTERRWEASALIAGHFLWPTLISGWGLVQLGYDPVAVIGGAACLIALVTALFLWLGLGPGSVLLAALPAFPANPLLVTGALLPGTGVWGGPVLLFWALLTGWAPRLWQRAGLLAAIALAPVVLHDRAVTSPEPMLQKIDLSGIRALTERGHWMDILSRVNEGDTLILGENILMADDSATIAWWCRAVETRNITALIGVMGTGGLGEVWMVESGMECPVPLYRAALGVPFVNAEIFAGYRATHLAVSPDVARPEIDWLICFEAFSLWRWISLGLNSHSPRPVVILANDRWTDPIPTASLRRKVTGAFAALYGREVAHADTRWTGVVLGR